MGGSRDTGASSSRFSGAISARAVHDRRTPSSGVGTSEEIILAAERDWPNGAFSGVVAHFEAAIVGKARQGVPARGRVADGLCE